MASRAPSRMTNTSTPAPQDPDAAWPLTENFKDNVVNDRKWFILTYPFGSEFPEGTPVIIAEYEGMPNTQPPTPQQGGGGGGATSNPQPVRRVPVGPITKHNTLYRFYKLNVVEKRITGATPDGVNAVLASKLSLQKNGRPVPAGGHLLEAGTMVYLLEDVANVRFRDVPSLTGVTAPKGTRVLICGNTSRDGLRGKSLATAGRHNTSTRYVLYVAVATEERTWARCRTAANHYNLRRLRLSDKPTIDHLNSKPAPPRVVDAVPSDFPGTGHSAAGGSNA